jgi:hypothetical protein
MTGAARIRGGGRVLGIAFLIVAPGLALGYFALTAASAAPRVPLGLDLYRPVPVDNR